MVGQHSNTRLFTVRARQGQELCCCLERAYDNPACPVHVQAQVIEKGQVKPAVIIRAMFTADEEGTNG